MKVILVTGGAGFIGSAVVRRLVADTDYRVVNVDKLTYAGCLESLADARRDPRHIFEKVDICNAEEIDRVLAQYKPQKIMHLAAESHVDRSIDGPGDFVQTNVVGTYNLLESTRRYMGSLEEKQKGEFVFHHVSTDEVFGSLGKEGFFTEQTPYKPNSPYSASKASADHLVRAWCKTYDLPAIITNCSNNYGPYQYPEKLIPLMITKAVEGKPLPVYGKGENVRDWLYVEDHAEALLKTVEEGVSGEVYNIGGHNELKNIEVVQMVCEVLDQIKPRDDGRSYAEQISFVADRPGHDLRYAIDAGKIERELGWRPRETFKTGLKKTVRWYLENEEWCRIVNEKYDGKRLGLGVAT